MSLILKLFDLLLLFCILTILFCEIYFRPWKRFWRTQTQRWLTWQTTKPWLLPTGAHSMITASTCSFWSSRFALEKSKSSFSTHSLTHSLTHTHTFSFRSWAGCQPAPQRHRGQDTASLDIKQRNRILMWNNPGETMSRCFPILFWFFLISNTHTGFRWWHCQCGRQRRPYRFWKTLIKKISKSLLLIDNSVNKQPPGSSSFGCRWAECSDRWSVGEFFLKNPKTFLKMHIAIWVLHNLLLNVFATHTKNNWNRRRWKGARSPCPTTHCARLCTGLQCWTTKQSAKSCCALGLTILWVMKTEQLRFTMRWAIEDN